MNGPGTGPVPDGTAPHGPVEERLRQALAARAESIGIRDLRPAAPPGPHLRRGRLSVLRRPWLRRFGLPLAAAAAAAAIAVGLLVTAPDGPPDRPLPARPPSPVSPAPSTGSDRPSAPEPSPTRPPATPTTAPAPPAHPRHRTAAPSGHRHGRGDRTAGRRQHRYPRAALHTPAGHSHPGGHQYRGTPCLSLNSGRTLSD